MANFSQAFIKIMRQEVGYANVPEDKGGETYSGISRVHNPDSPIWSIIDKYKQEHGEIKRGAVLPDINLARLVADFYRTKWAEIKADAIVSQPVATIIFDFYINSGKAGIKVVQKILNVAQDGIIGPVTLGAINSQAAPELHDNIKKARKAFFEAIVKRDPSQKVFLKGWLNGLNRFPDLKKKEA